MAWDGVQGMLLEASTQVEGINDVDIDDVYSARQLLMKRSVMSDVKAKLLEAAENQWEDWLEFSLFQAESLGLDYHEDVSIVPNRQRKEDDSFLRIEPCPSSRPVFLLRVCIIIVIS